MQNSYLWWCDFLDPVMLAKVQETAIANQTKFVPTTVSTGLTDYRRSTVLWHYDYLDLYQAFTQKLRFYLPTVQRELNFYFDIDQIEVQMTSSSNHGYFKNHNDNGTPDTATRRITFVYYFYLSQPQAFTGGELILDTEPKATILPNHNSIVWFPSHLFHEVMPVKSNGDFINSRMTCNGWVRATPTP